jgi:cell division control protein 6
MYAVRMSVCNDAAIVMVDKSDIERIIKEVEKENALFGNGKGCLDPLRPASVIVGREDEAKELVRLLAGGLGKGYAPPFISVYGRSGSGKSTLVRFVCEALKESGHVTACAFVNLRMARTVFSCARMILEELTGSSSGHAGGERLADANRVVDAIAGAIESLLLSKQVVGGEHGGFFVLVLDEFDALFSDRRGRPSDLVYQLLEMQEGLRQKKEYMMSIIAISNNAVFGHDLDDRVMSRMGSAAEVPFGAYSGNDVLLLLKEKAEKAAIGCDPGVLEYCAEICSQEHGDARRAIELLRAAGELASVQGQARIQKSHVDAAEEQLQRDRVKAAVDGAPYHTKAACAALARIAYLTGEEWHATSVLYDQYCMILRKGVPPLSYRRVSELLGGLVSAGLVVSSTESRGLSGYGTRYRLVMSPELVGSACFPEWWKDLEEKKKRHDMEVRQSWQTRFEIRMGQSIKDPFYTEPRVISMRHIDEQEKARWEEFVGVKK